MTDTPSTVRVKICCITSVDDAWLAIRHGAAAIGLVSEMPSGPGIITEERIAEIAATIPPGVDSFLLTSLTDPSLIIAQHGRCRTKSLQLCDRLDTAAYAELRGALPGVSLVQVLQVFGPEVIGLAERVAPFVDAVLLDSGGAPGEGVLGGTGKTHDWSISREIRRAVSVPVYLAGGLKSENIRDAIATVRPFGVDLCSGVRVDDRLDADRLSAFFAGVRDAESRS